MNGYGKRVPADEIPRTSGRNTLGVKILSAELAAAVLVKDEAEFIIQARSGMTERLRVKDVPVRRRANHRSRGVRLMQLDSGDRVAVVGLVRSQIEAETLPESLEASNPTQGWAGGRVGLRDSDSVIHQVQFGPLVPLTNINPGGQLASDLDAWVSSEVHKHSQYWCVHCGRGHNEPKAVYECIDSHINELHATPAE
jgi:hypothetical protein